MKRTVILLILALAIAGLTAGGLYYTLKISGRTIADPKEQPAPTPTPQTNSPKTVHFGGSVFAYDYFIVTNPSALLLIPNFTRPKDAETIMTDNRCAAAINGGFYDKTDKPLGYFKTDDKVYGTQIQSDLVNGFVWAEASSSAVISTDLTNAPYRFALQTGPVLMFDEKVLPLTINNDTPARRMLAAKNMSSQLLFMTIYNPDAVYDGPILADVPGIVRAISAKENLNIADAINLDGGSASAFYSGDTKLAELTSVGSIFCIQ